MSLQERIEKWWSHPGERISAFIGLWIILVIGASLFPTILMEIPQQPVPYRPTDLPYLFIEIGIVLAIVFIAYNSTEDNRG